MRSLTEAHHSKRPGRRELALFALGLAAVVSSAVFVGHGRIPHGEEVVFRWLNNAPAWLEAPIWLPMQLGNGLAIAVVAAVAVRRRRFRLALALGSSGLSVYLLSLGIKSVVNRGRPAALLDGVHLRGAHAHGHGYPSGHVAVAFALAGIACLWFGRRARWALLLAALIVAFGRIYVGAHLPLDVVAGAGIGTMAAMFVGLVLQVRHAGVLARRPRRIPRSRDVPALSQ